MRNPQPPEELQRLWLDQGKQEDVGMVIARVLRDARKGQRRARAVDLAVIAAYVVTLPMCLLMTLIFYGQAPYMAGGYLVWAMLLAGGLVSYRMFFRSLSEEPAPGPPRASTSTTRSIF